MRLVEIGGSYNPLVPRSEGWDVTVVDHADRAGLVAKYEHEPSVDVARIEEVDAVWTHGPLEDVLPETLHGEIDAVLASHVVEHLPDPVGFLRSVEGLLAPGGRLILAVPDMRACFDLLRAPTTTGSLVEAHVLGHERHSLRSLFDFTAHSTVLDGRVTWTVGARGALAYLGGFGQARATVSSFDPGDRAYVDCHAWQFTPASFELVLLELRALDLVHLEVASQHETVGCEFHVSLRRANGVPREEAELDRRRLELHRRALAELGASWVALDTGRGT